MYRIMGHIRTFSKRHPLIFNAVTYGGICGAAEVTQQKFEKRVELDKRAIVRYTVIGAVFMAPMLHGWYKWLDAFYPGTATRTVVKKLFMDAVLLGIPLYSVFYIGLAIMEGHEDVLKEWKKKFLPTYFLSLLLWIPLQTVNFSYVSPQRRVVFIAICTYLEVNLLCILKRWQF